MRRHKRKQPHPLDEMNQWEAMNHRLHQKDYDMVYLPLGKDGAGQTVVLRPDSPKLLGILSDGRPMLDSPESAAEVNRTILRLNTIQRLKQT